MAKCESCGVLIDDKYKYCSSCMNAWKADQKVNVSSGQVFNEIAMYLKQLNWNVGTMVLLKELELGLITKEVYAKLSKRVKGTKKE